MALGLVFLDLGLRGLAGILQRLRSLSFFSCLLLWGLLLAGKPGVPLQVRPYGWLAGLGPPAAVLLCISTSLAETSSANDWTCVQKL